jgi:hypothetical protein
MRRSTPDRDMYDRGPMPPNHGSRLFQPDPISTGQIGRHRCSANATQSLLARHTRVYRDLHRRSAERRPRREITHYQQGQNPRIRSKPVGLVFQTDRLEETAFDTFSHEDTKTRRGNAKYKDSIRFNHEELERARMVKMQANEIQPAALTGFTGFA